MGKSILVIAFLLVAVPVFAEQCPKYKRALYGNWIDEDHDGQDTRVEVLIEENQGDLVFDPEHPNRIISGKWFCPYTGKTFEKPSEVINGKRRVYLDIDHVVALREAHQSGAWKWEPEKKKLYANYLLDPNHLIAVSASANRSKGYKDVFEWTPKNKGFLKDYARMWIEIKVRWGLSADQQEFDALKQILSGETDIDYPLIAPECTEVDIK